MNTKQVEKAKAIVAKHEKKMAELTTVYSPNNNSKVATFSNFGIDKPRITFHETFLQPNTLELVYKKFKVYQKWLAKQNKN